MTPLTVGSLFSGIGGLDLGLERAGMTVVWQSEVDSYCCRVLAKHWPDVPNLGDVTRIDWTEVPRVDVICGGYPCQPFSPAGRRLGDKDPRHLWPWMLDAIRVLRPRWALLENVSGHLALGFGRVLGDLAEIGYDCQWDCIPAAAVGAPHRRDRVLVVAYPHGEGQSGQPVHAVSRPGVMVPDPDRSRLEGPGLRRSTAERRSDVAHPNGSGHGGTQDSGGVGCLDCGHAAEAWQRERAQPLVEHRGPSVADSNKFGRDGRTRRLRLGGWSQPAHSSQWVIEPDMGGALDGFSSWLDRSDRLNDSHKLVLAYADAEGESFAEAMRAVWRALRAEGHQWPARGRGCLSASEVLLAYVRQLAARCGLADPSLAGAEAPQDSVRGVWADDLTSRPSHGRSAGEQRPSELADALHALSQLLARHAGQAWAAYRRSDAAPRLNWESGVARVSTGVPHRVDRLRALGNAVVPQVAEHIGRLIVEAAA